MRSSEVTIKELYKKKAAKKIGFMGKIGFKKKRKKRFEIYEV